MSFISRINWSQGFFRFFLVISILWIALVGYNEVIDEDFTPNSIDQKAILETTSARISGPEPYIHCWFDELLEDHEVVNHPSRAYRRYSGENGKIRISAEDFAPRATASKVEMQKCAEVKEAQWIKEDQAYQNERLWKALMETFLPPICLFVFFYVARWILRGFRKAEE